MTHNVKEFKRKFYGQPIPYIVVHTYFKNRYGSHKNFMRKYEDDCHNLNSKRWDTR